MQTHDGVVRWRRTFVNQMFRRLIWSCERLIDRYSLIGSEPVFDASQFTWTDLLERNAATIRKECENILRYDNLLPSFHDVSPDQKRISTDDRWKTFFLFGLGHKSDFGCSQCPETARILESISGMTTAFFSILSPGKHVPPHRGVFKGLVRSHLALIVPSGEGECYMRVGNAILHWTQGRCLVFDDTFEHEVHNDTDEIRVVLLVDVIRPMRYPGRMLTEVLMWLGCRTAYVKDARHNYARWERQFEKAPTASSQLVRTVPEPERTLQGSRV